MGTLISLALINAFFIVIALSHLSVKGYYHGGMFLINVAMLVMFGLYYDDWNKNRKNKKRKDDNFKNFSGGTS